MAQIPPFEAAPVNPPRRGPGPVVTMDSIGESWQILQQDWGTWIGCSALVVIGGYMIQAPINFIIQLMIMGNPLTPKPFDLTSMLTLYAVMLPVSIIMQGFYMVFLTGMVHMAVRKQEGYAISVGDMFVGFKCFGRLYAASVLQILAWTFGFIFFIVPGLYAMSVLSFTGMYIVRHNKGATDAMQASYDELKGQAWLFIAVLLLAGICSLLGSVLCCIGIIITYPIYAIVVGINYYNFHQPPIMSPVAPEGFTPYPRGVQPTTFNPAPTAPTVETPSEPLPTPESIMEPAPEPPVEPEPPSEP